MSRYISRIGWITIFVGAIWIAAAPGQNSSLLTEPVTRLSVLPSATDPNIKKYDNFHWIYVDRAIIVDHRKDLAEDRNQLLLFIPGTHEPGKPRSSGPVPFLALAARLGYHVIDVSYPDEIPASVCRNDQDGSAFEKFRNTILEGGVSQHLSVAKPESVDNRLQKLLTHLSILRPRENWGQFLNVDGSINWEKVAVSGQSQGAGHAALIGIKHNVARVICFGGPKDYDHRLNEPAPYYSEASATSKDRFFAFNHTQDYVGGTSPTQLLSNLKALGLNHFGNPCNVDNEVTPFNHANILMTSFPVVDVIGPQSEGSLTAHSSMLNPNNAERWKSVWTYLLTANSH